MRSLLSLGSVVLLVALGPSVEALGKDRLKMARAQIAKAEKLVKKTEFVGAEKLFRNAIATEPLIPTAYLGLAKALVGQQRYADALATLEVAEQRYVDWEQAIQLGDMQKRLVAARQLQEAQDLQATAAERAGPQNTRGPQKALGPGQATAQRIQTEQFIFRERWALEGFEAIPSQVFYLEGISYLRTNRRTLGIEALEVCLLINSKHQLAHYNLAVALFTQSEFSEAKTHLDEAIAGGVEPDARFVADLELALASGG